MKFVMAGLFPAIHVFSISAKQDVDARNKAGHDEFRGKAPYFASTGSGGTLSLGAAACMVISVIETRS